jgi:acyl carrier protein
VTPARTLLAELIHDPELASQIPPDQPLLFAGVNSGDVVRLTLAVEERLGRALSEPEVIGMRTIADVDRLLATGPATAAGPAPAPRSVPASGPAPATRRAPAPRSAPVEAADVAD